MSGLPEIAEADAAGPTARLFADIRGVTGEPGVNLIYRHLATVPGALPWSWQRLRPLFVAGRMARWADHVRDAGRAAFGDIAQGDTIAARMPERGIADVLDFYLRTNPRNMVALAILEFDLAQVQPGGAIDDPDWLPPLPPAQKAHRPLVTMLRLDELESKTGADVAAIQRILSGNDDVIPSVLRQLAHWPAVIAVWREALARSEAEGRLDLCVDAMAGAVLRALDDPAIGKRPTGATGVLSETAHDAIGRAISIFQPLIPRVTAGLMALEPAVGKAR